MLHVVVRRGAAGHPSGHDFICRSLPAAAADDDIIFSPKSLNASCCGHPDALWTNSCETTTTERLSNRKRAMHNAFMAGHQPAVAAAALPEPHSTFCYDSYAWAAATASAAAAEAAPGN